MNFLRIYIIITLFPIVALAQPSANQLEQLLSGKDFKKQLMILDSLTFTYKSENPSMAFLYANREVEIALDSEHQKSIAHSLSTRSKVFKQLSNYKSAEADLNKALEIYTALDDKSWISSIYTDLGNLAYVRGEYDLAVVYYMKSLKISELLNDKSSQANVLNNIANVYLYQGQNNKAISYYKKALEMNNVLGDRKRAALTLDNIGLVYLNMEQFDTALVYQRKALEVVEEIGDKQFLSETLMNAGALYQHMEKYDEALAYFQRAYAISVQIDSKYLISGCLLNIGEAHKLKKNYSLALEKTMEAFVISDSIGAKSNLQKAAINLSDIYAEMKQFENSLKYYKIYSETKDSVFSQESSNQINELSAKYEADKRQNEIELLKKDNDLNKMINLSLFIGIGLVVVLLSLILYRYQEKRKANKLLEEKNYAIHVQKELVVEKNKEITDSINYARKIQDAMLPSQKILNEYFKDNFIFYQPKDIISGDFYWAFRKDNQLFIAAADCTGHGVPGALMSMIGVTFFRQIINEMDVKDTSEILNRLHGMILNTLNEDIHARNSKDGMDVALLKIDLLNGKAQFSGAVRPLYIVSNNGLEIIKGDRYSIGGIKTMDETFSSIDFELKGGQSFYLFSDGFADQFGQENGKKFMVKNLQNLLVEINGLTMQEQLGRISSIFNNWKGSLEQTDDVLLIGIKI